LVTPGASGGAVGAEIAPDDVDALPVADGVGDGATVGVVPGACDAELVGAFEIGVEPAVAPPPLHAAMPGSVPKTTIVNAFLKFSMVGILMVRSLTKDYD